MDVFPLPSHGKIQAFNIYEMEQDMVSNPLLE